MGWGLAEERLGGSRGDTHGGGWVCPVNWGSFPSDCQRYAPGYPITIHLNVLSDEAIGNIGPNVFILNI